MKDWFAGERGAYFFLWLGIGLIALFGVLEYRFPGQEQLQTARGRVTWQQETRGALYFTLSDQQLVLYAKGDADGKQRAAIRDAAMYPITVQFLRAQQTGIGFAPGVFYTAYSVAVGGKQVASLDQVRSDYRRDNAIALVMGIAAIIAGAWRVRALRATTSRRAGGGRPASRRSR
jgi:hypothetical protein